jgi:CIC family chloride channel protein
MQTKPTGSNGPRWIERWNALLADREDQVFLVLTLVIGAVVGLVVVAFILLTERLGARLYPPGGAAWRRVLVPVGGSLAMGYLLYKYFPEARGSGVPQTKAALYAKEGYISLPTVLGKFFCTSATLASGIPLGREGPAVQVGAGIFSVVGRRLGLSQERVKALLPVGAAAAIAAAFNTPVAAVLFALEEVLGDLHAPVLGSVVLASATSWVTLRLVLGNEPLFHVPQYELVHPLEFAVYAVLGVVGGLVSVVFTKLLLYLRQRFLNLPPGTRRFQPVAGGLAVGLLALMVPEVLGVGYGYVGDALNGRMVLGLMSLLIVFKLLAVTLSYASGNAGGIFGPTLFIGAMLGGVVGSVAHTFLPQYTASPGAYALVGMGTAFAGIVRAPMTSVIMIFETTRDYAVIVPLMISSLVSLLISRRLQRQPIYESLALQDGIHLPEAGVRNALHQRRVWEIIRSSVEPFPAQLTVQEAFEKSRQSPFHSWVVMDERGVLGVIVRPVLEQALSDGGESKRLKELEPALVVAHAHKDQLLPVALERMGAAGIDTLPVVSRANARELLGVITLTDILHSYGLKDLQRIAPAIKRAP